MKTTEHIAIDPTRGIVHHDSDEEAFGDWYEALTDEEADQYLITHSAMYL